MELTTQSQQVIPYLNKIKEKSDAISGEHDSGTSVLMGYSTANIIIDKVFATYEISTTRGYISDTESSKNELYEAKEIELEKLVGKSNFQSLDKKSRDFLIKIVGVIDFGVSIDIKKTLQYSIYNEEF